MSDQTGNIQQETEDASTDTLTKMPRRFLTTNKKIALSAIIPVVAILYMIMPHDNLQERLVALVFAIVVVGVLLLAAMLFFWVISLILPSAGGARPSESGDGGFRSMPAGSKPAPDPLAASLRGFMAESSTASGERGVDAAPSPQAASGIKSETEEQFLARIKPELDGLEDERKQKYAAYLKRRLPGFIMIGVGALLTVPVDYMLLKAPSNTHHYFGATGLLIVMVWTWVTQPQRDYANDYKENIIPRIAGLLGLKYKIDGGIPLSEMEPSKALPRHDSYTSKDYFEGMYKGARVRFCSVEIDVPPNITNLGNDQIYRGIAIMITMPKPKFYGHTVLASHMTGVGKWIDKEIIGLQYARMEDPEFERRYSVFTNDQVEARYLFDPLMLERIENLKNIYSSSDISMAYYQDQVLALIHCETQDLFEPQPIETPATDAKSVTKIQQELAKTLALIDYLDVYQPKQDAEQGVA